MDTNRDKIMNDKSEDTKFLREEINSFKKEDQDLLFNIVDFLIKNEDNINNSTPIKVKNNLTNKQQIKNLEKRVKKLEDKLNK